MREAEALLEEARAAKARGDVVAAVRAAEKALAIADAFRTPALCYRAHHELGSLRARRGPTEDLLAAVAHFEQALDLAQRTDDALLVARSARQLATVRLMRDELDEARRVLFVACAAAETLDDEPADSAACWLLLAEALVGSAKHLDRARDALVRARASVADLAGPAATTYAARIREIQARLDDGPNAT